MGGVVSQLVLSMASFLLLSMALWSWPSLLHVWLVLLLPGVVRRLAKQGVHRLIKNEMERCASFNIIHSFAVRGAGACLCVSNGS